MVFLTPLFLFYFLTIVLLVYYLVPFRFLNGVLMLASLFFYYWGEQSYAFVTKGKYSSMAVMSVPKASRNRPDTASISDEMIPDTQPIIPSKIQSNMGITSWCSLDFV